MVFAINCGSTSLKFGLYDKNCLLFEGEAEQEQFWFREGEQGNKQVLRTERFDQGEALSRALDLLAEHNAPKPEAIGHRVVHGGPQVVAHQRLTPSVKRQLEEARDFAPLHIPPALAAIESISRLRPDLPQVVCLDTAFHATLPDVSRTLALPRQVRDLGVRRYGFHGLSLESILHQLSPVPERLVVAHLGGGCSVTAIQAGRSAETTMGLTPTGGIMMGTRSGDLDPGVILYLQRAGYGDASRLEQVLDHESGLRGVSGLGNDMRAIMKARTDEVDPHHAEADLAYRMFVYQISRAVAAMAVTLNGLDLLVFAGGIGENTPQLREEVTRRLQVLPEFDVRVIPSQEDAQIARITRRVLAEAA